MNPKAARQGNGLRGFILKNSPRTKEIRGPKINKKASRSAGLQAGGKHEWRCTSLKQQYSGTEVCRGYTGQGMLTGSRRM